MIVRPSAVPSRRGGFVLLLVLVLIALAGLMAAGMARTSLRLALESLDAVEELQRRWGARSCELCLFPQAEYILAKREAELRRLNRPERVHQFVVTIELNDVTFDVTVADEDAKLSLNALAATCSDPEVTSIVRSLVGKTARFPPAIRLRPDRDRLVEGPLRTAGPERNAVEAPSAPVDLFHSWGQVFALHEPMEAPRPRAVATATSNLTCWGAGRLNVRRASDEALERLCSEIAGPDAGRRVLKLRREQPLLKPTELLSQLQMNVEQRRRLESLFTDQSSCYSLWIHMTHAERSWTEFCVGRKQIRKDQPAPTSTASLETPIQLTRFVW